MKLMQRAPRGLAAAITTAGLALLLSPFAQAADAAPAAASTADLEARVRALEAKLAEQATATPPAAGEDAPFGERRIATPADEPNVDYDAIDSGGLVPGNGASLYKGKDGEVWLSAYALFRAIDQVPSTQTAYDHLGNPVEVDPRLDMNLHRIMIHLKGWLYDERFRYALTTWTVNATEQVRVIGALTYVFDDAFVLSGGIIGLPGTRTLNYSHPYWLGHDRVMADEYFRPGFTAGVSANGKLPADLNYRVMVGNNISMLGVSTKKLTRDLAVGATMWWQPTTGEFGPQGGFGDFEFHEDVATRFGFSLANSREDRASVSTNPMPDSTQITLQDSRYLFEADSLAPGLTVQQALWRLAAVDAGVKYKGFFAGVEAYRRELSDFTPTTTSTASAPMDKITDTGYYVQTSYYPVPKKLEVYLSTSQVLGDKDAGFSDSTEYILGTNWYWMANRNQRVNFQVIDVHGSPVRSVFGYYGAALDGQIYSLDVSMMF